MAAASSNVNKIESRLQKLTEIRKRMPNYLFEGAHGRIGAGFQAPWVERKVSPKAVIQLAKFQRF